MVRVKLEGLAIDLLFVVIGKEWGTRAAIGNKSGSKCKTYFYSWRYCGQWLPRNHACEEILTATANQRSINPF